MASLPDPMSQPHASAGSALVEVSVVIPVFNEEQGLPLLLPRVLGVLEALDCTYELVFVDDGSSDGTLQALREAAQGHPIRIVELSRNFGKEVAVSAGLDHAAGRAVIVMDADLQDPPPARRERAKAG